MIIGHITTLQIEELERTGQAVITEKAAAEGVVSFPVTFERENERFSYKHNRRWIAEDSLALHGYVQAAEVAELRQALTEQHNRHIAATADMRMALQELLYAWEQDHSKEDGVAVDARAALDESTTRTGARISPFPIGIYAPDEAYDALGLTLLTDDQAVATWERVKESRRLSYVAAIYSGIDHDGAEE